MSENRIVIAGTNSGCGKTTITIALLAALKKRNVSVQPFKAGPDYIDTMFHTFVTEQKGRTLDSYLLQDDVLSFLFQKNCENADISVIEGVMGLYDGVGVTSEGSTAHIAKILQAPIILIVNTKGTSLSVAAIIKGFMEFDKQALIKGVIFNGIKTESQYLLLKQIVEQNTEIEVLGYLPYHEVFILESRHLGLITAYEIEELTEKFELLAKEAEKHIAIDRIMELASGADKLEKKWEFPKELYHKYEGITLGVAYDEAFCFYYNDNLDLLNSMGVKIACFSPTRSKKLPAGISGLYIGGGYPELYAPQLEQNETLRKEIKQLAENDFPIFAECGGLMYLTEKLYTDEKKEYEMVGALQGHCEMTKRLHHFGYVELETTAHNCMSEKEQTIKAHEFHYSKESIQNEHCFLSVKRRKEMEDTQWESGYCYKNLTACYPHIHFWSNLHFLERFLENCKRSAVNC